jgi:hypothetical protein
MDSRRVDFLQHARKKIRLLLIITFKANAIAWLKQLFHRLNDFFLLNDPAVTIAAQPQEAPPLAFSARPPGFCRRRLQAAHLKALSPDLGFNPLIPVMRIRNLGKKKELLTW